MAQVTNHITQTPTIKNFSEISPPKEKSSTKALKDEMGFIFFRSAGRQSESWKKANFAE